MAASYKFIIPVVLLVATALFFQNCGNQFNANGDPYETPNDGRFEEIDDGVLIVDSLLPVDGSTFTSSVSYDPVNPDSVVEEIAYDPAGAIVMIRARSGDVKYYPWDPSNTTNTVNNFLSSTWVINSITNSGTQNSISLTRTGTSTTIIESFDLAVTVEPDPVATDNPIPTMEPVGTQEVNRPD